MRLDPTQVIANARALVRKARPNFYNDEDEEMAEYEIDPTKPNPTGMMDKRWTDPPKDAEEARARLRELSGEVDLTSPLNAAKIYEQRKEARVERLRAQRLFASVYRDDEEKLEQPSASLLDASSVYAQRADAREQRSKR